MHTDWLEVDVCIWHLKNKHTSQERYDGSWNVVSERSANIPQCCETHKVKILFFCLWFGVCSGEMRLEAHQQPLNLNTKEEEKDKWINSQGTKWYRDKNIDLIQAYDNRVNLAKHDRKHLAA